ncbi:MBL fold metallo-hydrolase [Sabulicella rubraurantiaca]|uniref:MBL fold metallo-hydrolase n=1 Tax=Sabulicella rubraurantiaca TaxID=2811429 RepID=UPI001A973EB2|nr:MBL fold metallo-hydrolase [Sabulicella rubraurantiaca]
MSLKKRVRLTLLGTGPSQGVPAIGGSDGRGDWGSCDPSEPRNRRRRTSALLTCKGTRILIDAGPDCREQLLSAGASGLDGVVFTHAHADHVMGIDELRQVNRNIGQVLPAFGFPETLRELQGRFAYAFREATPGFFRPALESREVDPCETFVLGHLSLRACVQDHAVMRTMGLRCGNIAYCTDVVRMPPETLAALSGVATLVLGCFRLTSHPVHAGLREVLAWAEAIGPRRVVLTHMGSTMDWETLRRELPTGIEPGHDGMELDGEA